jgi:succinate dehydrogenase / fumarate reductase cytochrome b subunit
LEEAIERREAAKTIAPTFAQAPGRRHFIIRRLHSLTGLVFGGYLATHLLVNATGLWPSVYQQNVDHIHSMEPMLPLIELAAIFIPLLIHALYGIYIAFSGVKFNTTKYHYGGNLRYTLQRWTALVLLMFIAFHVGTLHKWGLAGVRDLILFANPSPSGFLGAVADWCNTWGGLFSPGHAYESTVTGIRTFYDNNAGNPVNLLVDAFYLVGIWCACFHFANGLWTSAIAWGLTVTASSQKRFGNVCLGFFLGLTTIGTIAWMAFTVLGRTP